MIRITGGDWSGRSIKAPPGDATRPTASKVRQALFNMLQADTDDARFIDLCCGAGTMGIEALSRGAEHVVFCESNRRTQALLRQNLERVGASPDRFTVSPLSAEGWALGGDPGGDIVFCDPPYQSKLLAGLLPALASNDKVLPGGWLVAETSSETDLSDLDLPGFTLDRAKRYGDTMLWIWGCG